MYTAKELFSVLGGVSGLAHVYHFPLKQVSEAAGPWKATVRRP